MKILYVVRHYGPVGGMERYVWETTRELTGLGHQIEVLCERCHVEPPHSIIVHALGDLPSRPRWLTLLRFGGRVARWLAQNPRPGFILHSHERLGLHHITTFHGPPFATVRDKPLWKRVSLRVAMQLYLERRELRTARRIVPNSTIIRKQLAHYYPEYAAKLSEPIVPGVAAIPVRDWQPAPPDGGVIGFVGKEWQRKGLPLVVDIVAQLRKQRPKLELWVAGPSPEAVRHLFDGWQGGYRLLGWRTDGDYLAHLNVLVHPARAEPYGMAIAEAMAARVAVVVSDRCGAAAQVAAGAGAVLPLEMPVEKWAGAVAAQLQRTAPPPVFTHSWHDVAKEYEALYLATGREET